MRGWWYRGVHMNSLSTYCFLVKCNIPMRMDSLPFREWQTNINGMLTRIPYEIYMDEHFYSIESKLLDYEKYLEDAPMLLELAIWKSNITSQLSQNTADMRMQSCADSISMVTIIVRNVLSFL